MSFNRTASHLAPILLGNGTRAAFARSTAFHRQVPAFAVLVARRGLSGEPQTSSTDNANYPPPGFNAGQAQKPLANDAQQHSKAKLSDHKSQTSAADVDIASSKPSEHAPTKAQEALALKELAAQSAAEEKAEEKKIAKKKEDEKKLTLGQKIMKEVHHYWDGTKLLATEVRISSKLALKMGAGYELTRREHRQVSLLRHGIVLHAPCEPPLITTP